MPSLVQTPLQFPQPLGGLGQTHVAPEQLPLAGHGTHVPPQFFCPLGQTHALPEQLPPAGHVTHALPQRVNPGLQMKSHLPLVHVAVPLAGAVHWWPHAPQFCVSPVRLKHALPH